MSSSDAARSRTTTPLQTAAAAVGAIFLLVGIAGFIPGVTTNYDDMMFAGHESGAELLGVFNVSILHNLVHLAFGIAGLALARSWATARNFLVVGGVVYLGLWVYGLVVHGRDDQRELRAAERGRQLAAPGPGRRHAGAGVRSRPAGHRQGLIDIGPDALPRRRQ